MDHPTVEAVVFDLDGVLIDSEPMWRSTEIRVYATLGLTLTDEQAHATKGMGLREAVEYWRDRAGGPNWDVDAIGEQILRTQVERMRDGVAPMPGVLALIDRLRGRVRLAVASSSWHDVIDAALDGLGVRDVFEVVHSAQDEARGKPAPDVYLTTARKLSVAPEACLAIEDSPAGVRAAKAAGMRCIAVPEPGGQQETSAFDLADVAVTSLEQIDERMLAALGVPPRPGSLGA